MKMMKYSVEVTWESSRAGYCFAKIYGLEPVIYNEP